MATVLCGNDELIVLALGGEILPRHPPAGPAIRPSLPRISFCLHLRPETGRFTVMGTGWFPILVRAVMTALKGANVFVTGDSRGIGKALVEELYVRGAGKVYATARDPRTVTHPDAVPVALESPTRPPWRRPPHRRRTSPY
jgi:hypothetical protein